ncbi:hypothetical protein AVEN_214289-1 [Araneus ventricosus]|uniref:Uncharacterized protein n=1 Tax=Araneus ventricosus TaxID=182803 RepID=A0A4Y2J943_ARAVE|nr:hypothetical protein AVEN_214289-1 [Araneus ventricosus]
MWLHTFESQRKAGGYIRPGLKAKQETTYVRVSRLNKVSHPHNQSFCPADHEPKFRHYKFHPDEFNIEEKSSLTYQHINSILTLIFISMTLNKRTGQNVHSACRGKLNK